MKKLQYCFLLMIPVFFACNFASKEKKILSDPERKSFTRVGAFIKANWVNTIRTHRNDSADLIGLPKPYTVPSIKGMFQEMYYWDTYFTNLGIILDGNVEQAKNNCDDMIFLVDKYGFMPNGNRTFYLNRSQPPYLSMMIRDVFEKTKDTYWLGRSLPVLEKEYNFWMTKRITPIGLNRFSNFATASEKEESMYGLGKRLGENYDTSIYKTAAEKITAGSHFLAECESGWDFNPRFERRCEDFCPVDLNSNLYMYENNFAFFYSQLQNRDSSKWTALAERRKALMNKFLFNSGDGLFYDYDFVNNNLSTIYSAGVFSALWSNIATKQQAQTVNDSLSKLEFNYGIAACTPGKRQYNYQWDYPNGWPCLQFLAMKGLHNYGFDEAAKRIAYKYVSTVAVNFEKTNNLWEKYNITDGTTTNVSNEYDMPAMMGWTAGVYVYLSDYLLKK